jgi:hypothetical protein
MTKLYDYEFRVPRTSEPVLVYCADSKYPVIARFMTHPMTGEWWTMVDTDGNGLKGSGGSIEITGVTHWRKIPRKLMP